ncbi:MAG: nuclear transport factor 2 family protein [Dehalococcoidales bacterium]|nr:nuclear transport factor 2 family protein [Dehalococcoidales bacterium]
MLARDTWYALNDVIQRDNWDEVIRYFAPECSWRLMPPGTVFRGSAQILGFLKSGWNAAAARQEPQVRNDFACGQDGVFEYTSRGTIDAQKATQFAAVTGAAQSPVNLVGKEFSFHVCFVYHVNVEGLIDRVNEYAAPEL